MSLKSIALQIPAEYRREILELNMISKAVATTADPSMYYLFTIWKNYIEPTASHDCGLCLGRILDNYRGLQDTLIEMEKESRLLDQL